MWLKFQVGSMVNIMCANVGATGKTCPLNTDYNYSARSREFSPSAEVHGKTMTCTVKMRELGQDTVNTSIRLNVRRECILRGVLLPLYREQEAYQMVGPSETFIAELKMYM